MIFAPAVSILPKRLSGPFVMVHYPQPSLRELFPTVHVIDEVSAVIMKYVSLLFPYEAIEVRMQICVYAALACLPPEMSRMDVSRSIPNHLISPSWLLQSPQKFSPTPGKKLIFIWTCVVQSNGAHIELY